MKNLFILAVSILISTSSLAQNENTKVDASTEKQDAKLSQGTDTSASPWITLTEICYFNEVGDALRASAACDKAAETVNMLSNDRLTFQTICYHDKEITCSRYNAYILQTKALVVK